MSKLTAVFPASGQSYEPPKPTLPCPTSPTQQTDNESWEHLRGPADPSPYDRYYRDDHIDDRAGLKSDKSGS